MSVKTMIVTPIDFEQDGKQSDFLRLPHSANRNGFGWIPIPIICIKNGDGPTAILFGGNHGDEYEGMVALMKLARELEVDHVQGRVIIIPALNYPAVKAGTRNSPIDGGNLNRLFPGDALGTPTQAIAHYVSTVLLPMADLVFDIHAGGFSSEFILCSLTRREQDPIMQAKNIELMKLFGAPIGYISTGTGGGAGLTLSGETTRQKILNLTAELGGGGAISRHGLEIAEQGIRRVLKHIQITPNIAVVEAGLTRFVENKGHECRINALVDGVFEPFFKVGDEVKAGQLAAHIHFPDFPMREPDSIYFEADALLGCQHIPALVARGDGLITLLTDINDNE